MDPFSSTLEDLDFADDLALRSLACRTSGLARISGQRENAIHEREARDEKIFFVLSTLLYGAEYWRIKRPCVTFQG